MTERRRWRRLDDALDELAHLGSDPDLAADLRRADEHADQTVRDPFERGPSGEPA